MAISIDDVRYMATLARLQIADDEAVELAAHMNSILRYMEKLDSLDTSDVPPMSHVLDIHNVYRKDAARQRISHREALKNAPDADGDYFRVPKVIA